MKDFMAAEDRALLESRGLDSFAALWALELPAVDAPNTERGGWSSVCRLELGERAYYLKRQRNHLTRSLLRPQGEPTFARELRNIQRYRMLGIPALQAAFYAERKIAGEQRAILLTRALDDWRDLAGWLQGWAQLAAAERQAVLNACGALLRRLHGAGQLHGCLYPKHIFLRRQEGGFEACLIDLEKTRPLLLGRRDRVRDLETLLRRAAPAWGEDELRQLLGVYLAEGEPHEPWLRRLAARQRHKATRA
ncbi:lipopolysaccharide kinase InaA family protein [Pseudomonas stutzeri]|nr:lipopolysaccharide kinase InaA family protein [Stutzerimonas stutzeri]